MAQKSKKQQIADAALMLFLQHGFKGTSVDMVVKASGVSKPTVYNHFPDKAALIDFIVAQWLSQQPEQLTESNVEAWLNDENLGLVRLAIGEGQRFTDTRSRLFHYIDDAIREPLRQQQGEAAVLGFNSTLLQRLMTS